MIQVFTPHVVQPGLRSPKKGSIGGRFGVSRLIHGVSPFATAASSSPFQSALLPPAVPIRSFLARLANNEATDLPKARPLAISLDVALPDHNAASRCSSAFRVISSTAAGNSSFRISAVTPESTASYEGYAGRSVSGIRDLISESVLYGDGL